MSVYRFEARWSELVRRTSLRGQRTDERAFIFFFMVADFEVKPWVLFGRTARA